MDHLFARIVQELERSRPLPPQVIRNLNSTYGISREEIGTFLDARLQELEDYEVDLILSPVFTPGLQDQAIFATTLGGRSISSEQIDALIERIVARPTVAHLVGEDGSEHAIRLREVSVARYVRRLRLEGSAPDALVEIILRQAATDDQAIMMAVARRAVWSLPGRGQLLEEYLKRVGANPANDARDLLTLLRLAETYEPSDLKDFRSRLPTWIEAVRAEAGAALNPRPFFNNRVEDLHGGGRDQRRSIDPKSAAREADLQSMLRLQDAF